MKFKQVTLITSQLASLKTFYTELLGIPLIDSDEHAFSIDMGQTQLIFKQGESYLYHLAFNIPRNQFAEGKAWLAERVPLVDVMGNDQIHFTAWNAHSVYFYDTAGNIMEFIARHDLDNDSDVPFSGTSLCSISEVGMVTDDVQNFTKSLKSTFDVPVYDGDGSDVFSAIGDPEGLLIVVPEGREWFPATGIHATFCPLEIVFDDGKVITYNNDGEYHLNP